MVLSETAPAAAPTDGPPTLRRYIVPLCEIPPLAGGADRLLTSINEPSESEADADEVGDGGVFGRLAAD